MAKIIRITKPGDKVAMSQAERNAKRNLEMGPGLYAMARGIVKAGVEYAKDGFQNVSKETHEKRLAICASCEFWIPGKWFGTGGCKQCGCSRLKHHMRTMVCPLGKWGGEE